MSQNPLETIADLIMSLFGRTPAAPAQGKSYTFDMGTLGTPAAPNPTVTGPQGGGQAGIGIGAGLGAGMTVYKPRVDPDEGILAAIIAHGLLVQAKFAEYLVGHAHASPTSKLSEGDYGIKLQDENMLIRCHCEWQPVHFYMEDSSGDFWWDFWKEGFYKDRFEKEPISESVKRYWEFARKGFKGSLKNWDHHWHFDDTTPDWTKLNKKIELPYGAEAYRNGSAAKKRKWRFDHMMQASDFFNRCRALVQYGEWWRCHSDYNNHVPPKWWVDHCIAHGVGCARADVIENWRNWGRPSDLGSLQVDHVVKGGKVVGENIFGTEQVLRFVVKHTPLPGSISWPLGKGLLCDWPRNQLGIVEPNFGWLDNWGEICVAAAKKKIAASAGMKICRIMTGVVVSMCAAATGGAAGALASIGSGLVGGTLGTVVQTVAGKLLSSASSMVFELARSFLLTGKTQTFNPLEEIEALALEEAKGLIDYGSAMIQDKVNRLELCTSDGKPTEWTGTGFSKYIYGNLGVNKEALALYKNSFVRG